MPFSATYVSADNPDYCPSQTKSTWKKKCFRKVRSLWNRGLLSSEVAPLGNTDPTEPVRKVLFLSVKCMYTFTKWLTSASSVLTSKQSASVNPWQKYGCGFSIKKQQQEWRGLVTKGKTARMEVHARDLIFTDETFQSLGTRRYNIEVYREIKDGARQNEKTRDHKQYKSIKRWDLL